MMTGIIFALLGGISLGGITSFAALSYQHGVAPLELIALRGVIAAVIMVSLCLFQRQPLFLNQSGWRYGGLVGLSLAMVGFGYMGSVAYISPGLAVAILYLYPIIVLVADSLKLRQMPPMLTIIGFSVALFGIVICVGIGGPIHPIGIGLALMASLGMAGFLLSSADASQNGHGNATVIWANFMIIAMAGLALIISTPESETVIRIPEDPVGGLAIVAASTLYAIGILMSVLALRIAPAPLVALMMNVEPLTTLIAARVIVGETLSLYQYGGMIMAILGIVLGSLTLWKKPL